MDDVMFLYNGANWP